MATTDQFVYTTTTGDKYHGEGCHTLTRWREEGKKPTKITLAEAKAQGIEPCDGCVFNGRLPKHPT